MKRALLGMVLAGTLTSCRYIPGTEAHQIAEAEKAVAYQLRDPDSAKFRNLRVVTFKGNRIVCGEVNGHNAVGGYDGFTPFFYSIPLKKASILPTADQMAASGQIIQYSPEAISCIPPNSPWLNPSGSADGDSDDLNAAANEAIADVDKATADANLRQAEKDAREPIPSGMK